MTGLDTGTEDLLAEVDDGVAVITMNRPSRRNAFSNDMVEALGRVLAQVELSDEVGCVVLTGAGDAFSAGGDVKAMADRGSSGGPSVPVDVAIHRQRLNQRATSGKLWRMPKPTIAHIPGPAAGAGPVARLGLRSQVRGRNRHLHHRLRSRCLRRRLRRNLVLDQTGRPGEG